MSLRAFHIFFVTIASLFCLWFGMWNVDQFQAIRSGLSLLFAGLSFVGGFGLLFYLWWFVRHTRQWSLMLLPLLLGNSFFSAQAVACAVCFGSQDSAMVQGANAGIGFLLAVICVVLIAFASLFIVWIRKAQRLGQ